MNAARQLKPLAISDMLDQAFRLYRANFVLLISIVAVLFVPTAILSVVSQLLFHTTLVVDLIQGFFIQTLATMALILAISRAYLGESVSISEAYGESMHRYFSLLGAALLEGMAVGVPAAVLGCGAAAVGGGLAGIFLILLIVPYAVYMAIRWATAMPCIVVETVGASAGLSRSWALTSGLFWRVLGISTVAGLLTFLVAELPALTIQSGLALVVTSQEATTGPLISALITPLSLILTLPFSMAVIVLLYYDLRVRKEGYDLELRAQEMAPV